MKRLRTPWVFIILYCIYAIASGLQGRHERHEYQSEDRVVISAPMQLVLYAGDRYLAANFETIRLATTGLEVNPATGTIDGRYLLRAHRVVAELNACHEDNYYLANAILSWAGANEEVNDILWLATQCRYWDFLPPFLYGFNQYFFDRNILEAQEALEFAAERSPENANAMRRFAVMIGTEQFDDESMALAYLKQQQEQAKSDTLAKSLQERVIRLEGLLKLREAQAAYEADYDRPLSSPQDLLESGLIDSFPADPLGIGYEFEDGQFKLRQLRIQGVERPQ